MIYQYSQFVKNKLSKQYGQYLEETFNKYYLAGLNQIIPIIKFFAETINDEFIDKMFYKVTVENCSIEQLVSRGEIEIMMYSSDTVFKLKDAKGFIVYTKTVHSITKEEKIYLLLICIDKSYRKYGYGKVFMEEFIEFVKKSNDKSKRIILHSLDTSLQFYLALGFTKIPDKIINYRKLFKYEKYNKETMLLQIIL